jgi:hypothetical protein
MSKQNKKKKTDEKKPKFVPELDPQHQESLDRLADVGRLMSTDWSARLSYLSPRKAA